METIRKGGKNAVRSGWDLALQGGKGAVGGFKDALLEMKDSVRNFDA